MDGVYPLPFPTPSPLHPSYLPAGAETLQRLLTDSLPDSFFPDALPFSTKDGYTVLNMCSVQVGAQGPGSRCHVRLHL